MITWTAFRRTPRSMTVRGRLFLLVLVAAVPLLLFTLAMALWNGSSLRDIQIGQAGRISEGSMQAVDREISSAITGLQVLAASPALERADFKAFHDQARAAVGIASDSVIILYDPEGNRLVSTAVNWGEPVPPRKSRAGLDPALASGDVHVTPLFVSETSGKPTIGIVVPVLIGGQVRYLISAGILSQSLSGELSKVGVPPDWIVSVLDQNGTIVARTKDAPTVVGRPALPSNWEAIRASASLVGSFEGRTQEGAPVLLSFARSRSFGWTTVVAIPLGLLSAPTNASLTMSALAGLVLLLLASTLAWYSAKRIYLATDELVAAATALERGTVVGPLRSGIEQFDLLADAMRDASGRIREREVDLSTSLAQLRSAHQELRREQEKKDQFIATLAHELRNPLAPIRMGVHLLNRSVRDPQHAKTLSMITRQVNHMVRLIDDLMDVSRIARGLVRLAVAPAELGKVVAQAVEASEPSFALARLACTVELPPEPVWAHLDVVRMSQMLSNLLGNAAKFTPAGGRVTVRLAVDDDVATITIADTGIGIPPDRIEQIFELFTQLGPAASSPGLGIGLSIARRLVALHGGTLNAHSEGEGRGATFVLTLPTAPMPARLPRAPQRGPAHVAGTRRILLVDDNQDAAEVLASTLRSAGHEVHVAHDGPQALQLAARHGVDIAFLDIGMPGMDGYELCRRLRGLASCASARIVALTGWGGEADRRRAREAGFDDHLTKPVDWPEVARQLSEAAVA